MWQVIRNVQSNNSGMQNNHSPNLLIMNDNTISEPNGIANAFNSFFISVSAKYAHEVNSTGFYNFDDVQYFVSSKLPNGAMFEIPEISDEFVLKFLQNLDPQKATGLDGTPS